MTQKNSQLPLDLPYQGDSLWDLLTDELITEILTKLPAKPLCRFKCVSKRWNSVITHPYFLTTYISRVSTSCVILDRVPQLADESTQYVTQFNFVDPPKVCTSSINPHKLAAEPVTDRTRSKYPIVMLQSSNGLILFTLSINRDPHKEHKKDPTSFSWRFEDETLFVVNPITRELVPLPKPGPSIMKRTSVAFTSKLDPVTGVVDKFLVIEYQPIIGSKLASLMYFSSDIGKWAKKPANYMLGAHFWRAEGSFDFNGKLFWVDVSTGLITWDANNNDPFANLENNERAKCRFIPLPIGRAKRFNTPKLEDERWMGEGGGYVHYLEVFKEVHCVLKVWRLKSCECGEWSLKYKVSRDNVERCLPCGFDNGMPKPCFVHPFEGDVVYFETGKFIFSLNVRTSKVENCGGFDGHKFVFPFVLPKWPSPLPKRLYAAYAKEQGNECFKSQNFIEAIECYSKSIDLSPNTAAFANRAMAYLKLNKYHEAENDCTESLKLDADYFKVYWRRAIARKALGCLEGALEDAELGLKLEPENEQVKKLRAELKTMLEKASCPGHQYGEKGEA